MMLLVDLGNSRLKWARADGATLVIGAPLDHAQPLRPQLDRDWTGAAPVERALVASVARPELESDIAAAIAAHYACPVEFVRSSAQACGVRSAYAQPGKLGVDRFLALIALHAQGAGPVVHAGVGTALTLDALAADGTHLGGLIAPSPAVMVQALTGATARLTTSPSAQVHEIAVDTEDAVQSGCWLAAAALVERFAAQAQARLGTVPRLVVSGGGAPLLRTLVAGAPELAADLVLRGLLHYARNG